ncbi:MAG: UvrD-helicase domain-containing protein, partial [Bacteroidota bacterium]|nr:UvrD-helicase domain-containing protein [Bacteroidota bacterium]
MQTNYFDLTGHNLTGINLIEASAGTGKTYTITGLFLRLLLEKELSVRDILVVTFTEAATEELKDRIRKGISGLLDALKYDEVKDNFQQDYIPRIKDRTHAIKLLKEALINFDEANIFTIHSFCRRMLN